MSKEKAKIINVKVKLGEDKKRRIPRVLDTIYRIIKTPVCDDDNPDDDETLFTRTLETVDVEGVTVVDNGRAVNVNGDFEISLEDEDDDEKYSDKKIWAEKEEAIAVWEHNTELELKEAKKRQEKYDHIVTHLQRNLDEKQY
jgi:hypothetical protein